MVSEENRFRKGETFVQVTQLIGRASVGIHVGAGALNNTSAMIKFECSRSSGKKMRLPVGQGSDGELVVFISCVVIGWVPDVCIGEDEVVSEIKRMKSSDPCMEKNSQPPPAKLKSGSTFNSFLEIYSETTLRHCTAI